MFNENDVKRSMDGSIEHLQKELKGLRTGRANPAILDGVFVDVYGTKMKLKELANITTPEARQILITPYDRNNVNSISKAIEESNLNLNPQVDGNVVRINVPPMDQSVRDDMVKLCKRKGEDAKISIREHRRKYNEMAKMEKASGEITEDIQKKLEKMVQDKTDNYCKEVDLICSKKENEIKEI